MLVQKNSWEHTSVQWDDTARQQCPEVAATDGGRPGTPRKGCAALRASILAAAERGVIEVRDDEPVPTPIFAD